MKTRINAAPAVKGLIESSLLIRLSSVLTRMVILLIYLLGLANDDFYTTGGLSTMDDWTTDVDPIMTSNLVLEAKDDGTTQWAAEEDDSGGVVITTTKQSIGVPESK